MPLVTIIVIGSLLFCTIVHYETLRALNKPWRLPFLAEQGRVMIVLLGSLASHLIHILLFAMLYYLLRDKFGLGNFGGQFQDSFNSFLYFSAETYTSVGFGDIYPLGLLRMISSIETLIGLLLIIAGTVVTVKW